MLPTYTIITPWWGMLILPYLKAHTAIFEISPIIVYAACVLISYLLSKAHKVFISER